MSRILSYLTICSFCSFLACSPAEPEVESSILSSERSINPIVTLTDEMFNSLHSVVVHQAQDAIYNQAVNYTAYPLNEVLIQAFPNWKDLLLRDAVLIMRSTGGYSPQMSFADGFSERLFLLRNFQIDLRRKIRMTVGMKEGNGIATWAIS